MLGMRPLSRAVAVAFLAVALLCSSSATPVHAAAGPKGPGGTYAGAEVPAPDNPIDAVDISFKVSKNGRKIQNWLVTMNVICVSYPPYVQLISQSMPTMKVKRNGRFHGVFAGTQDGTEYHVEVGGRLVAKKNKVKAGTLSYEVGVCQRGNDAGDPLRWTAKRTGR